MESLETYRAAMRAAHLKDDDAILAALAERSSFTSDFHTAASARAEALVTAIREDASPGLMEVFLAEYGLSTDEGIALMCLAEALLRVPDADTIDALIEDKIAPSAWGAHLGKSSSSLVNASTWALMLTGKVLQDGNGMASVLRSAVKRLGEPVIRVAVSRAMKELGAQFVLGETIDDAIKRGRKKQSQGYTYSYDMLGEAALTDGDAALYFDAYADAIARLAKEVTSADIRTNPGISIKLSALHPRYELGQKDRVMAALVPRTLTLARHAKAANMGLNIDAEEADRLDLSLDVIQAVLRDESLAGWDGFGVVVQAYGKRASQAVDWLYALASQLDRKIMVRLVKGAYWDTEVKRSQVEGLSGFPVFTQKAATDVSYICCAKQLLGYADRIYPQFATHNAHSIAAIMEMGHDPETFEFQRLHGMGEALHDIILSKNQYRSRIYAPVGAHEDLLAYLVRRLLENGANSSFVNQIVDTEVPASEIARDPFAAVVPDMSPVRLPQDLYGQERSNSCGWDLHNVDDLAAIDAARDMYRTHHWDMTPLIAGASFFGAAHPVLNPAVPTDNVGSVTFCTAENVTQAIAAAKPWSAPAAERAAVLNRAADLYEAQLGLFFAVLAREAGKTPNDVIGELREAVDFLRYYAARATELTDPARGIFTCISPWNFPLAIFTGQISAALAAGNGVLAKPAESTSITGILAAKLLHEAGVPLDALQLLPGEGAIVGAMLTATDAVGGVCFTGSTATAQTINRTMADHMSPRAPLIAETGGLNAMIVDSTALPEQAVRDIVASAFQSAGQRCSALRVLYVQTDVADSMLEMLYGAMDALRLGDPWDHSTDVGPVIDQLAKAKIMTHINAARAEGRVLHDIPFPTTGTFVPPTVIAVDGIGNLTEEIFGPVLHVARFAAEDLDKIVKDINGTGYGLTFGIHSRIDDRVHDLTEKVKAGNIYVNRNQIGAVVGSQPFGGEGLSGTGPKAGGPAYVQRFTTPGAPAIEIAASTPIALDTLKTAMRGLHGQDICLSSDSLLGPTGESNVLSRYGRGTVLCLGPGREAALSQAKAAQSAGCQTFCVAPGLRAAEGLAGHVVPEDLTTLQGIDVVLMQADDATLRPYRQALAARTGKLIPLVAENDVSARCTIERHVCIDTTAAGGNATLLAEV